MDTLICARCELEEPDTDELIIEPWETGDAMVHHDPNICIERLKTTNGGASQKGNQEKFYWVCPDCGNHNRGEVEPCAGCGELPGNEDKNNECCYCGISDKNVSWIESPADGTPIAPAHDNPYRCILALRGRLMAYVFNTTDDKEREID